MEKRKTNIQVIRTSAPTIHCWEGMKEYKPIEDDIIEIAEGGIERIVKILKEMPVNQYYPVIEMSDSTRVFLDGKWEEANLMNTSKFQNYLERLKELGIDVGHGNSEYGYRMPLPQNGKGRRQLIIFRRR